MIDQQTKPDATTARELRRIRDDQAAFQHNCVTWMYAMSIFAGCITLFLLLILIRLY